MGLKVTITIDGARTIDRGVWKAKLKPEEVKTIGDCDSKSGPFSVLLLESNVDYNQTSQTITFDPNATRLLNIGSTNQVIVLSSKISQISDTAPVADPPVAEAAPSRPKQPLEEKTPAAAKAPEYELSQELSTGDKLFLSELPLDIRDLGEMLLAEVRKHFPGELNYEPRAAKFDETPEIFWTVKIQPQDKSLQITVRGTPNSFKNTSEISLKLGKFGYSSFVLNRKDQIPEALTALKQAKKNML